MAAHHTFAPFANVRWTLFSGLNVMHGLHPTFTLLGTQALHLARGLEGGPETRMLGVGVASVLDAVGPCLEEAARVRTPAAAEMVQTVGRLRNIQRTGEGRAQVPSLLRDLGDYLHRLAGEVEASSSIRSESGMADPGGIQRAARGELVKPRTEVFPSFNEARAWMETHFKLSGYAAAVFSDLSGGALRGLYILLASRVPMENLRLFLESPAVKMSAGADRILRLMAHLYDAGVIGFETGFIVDAFFKEQFNYLAQKGSQISGQMAEHQEAARYALHDETEMVLCNTRMPINWGKLNSRRRRYVEEEVLGDSKGGNLARVRRSYNKQREVNVDIIVVGKGTRRIVEVKNSFEDEMKKSRTEIAIFLLQIFRHALLCEQHGLEGVELRLKARTVNSRLMESLCQAFSMAGIDYCITIGRTKRERADGNLTPLPHVNKTIQIAERPLPPLPGTG